MNYRGKRQLATWGGLLAGLGLGSCLALWLSIFEIANPKLGATCNAQATNCDNIQLSSLYPSMGLTVFLVLLFGATFGLGLGLVASALIRNENTAQAEAASVTATPQTV
jgi:hypothetical protein